MDIKLTVLTVTEYNLIGTKDPSGSYDRKTRENLYWIIEKLRTSTLPLSKLESRLLQKFRDATFGALEEKDKTKDEVNLALDEKDNKASGFALKAVDSSAKGRPSILRIVAYYSGGEVR